MSSDLEKFEARADELIKDAMRMTREKDGVGGVPEPRNSIHRLLQLVVPAFIAVTKALLLIFTLDGKGQ